MKRPVMQTLETEDGMKGVPYPHDDEWTIRQLQVRFALFNFPKHEHMIIGSILYIAYHYGECFEVLNFSRFYMDFWDSVGRFLENKDIFDLIDEKFIDWVEVMQFEEMCEEVSMDFDRAFKRFCFTGE